MALSISLLALIDARLSCHNAVLLLSVRRYLQWERAKWSDHTEETCNTDRRLDVNFREIGREIIGRIGMDIMLAFGAVAVGVETLMAIGGANPHVYRTSNL